MSWLLSPPPYRKSSSKQSMSLISRWLQLSLSQFSSQKGPVSHPRTDFSGRTTTQSTLPPQSRTSNSSKGVKRLTTHFICQISPQRIFFCQRIRSELDSFSLSQESFQDALCMRSSKPLLMTSSLAPLGCGWTATKCLCFSSNQARNILK